MAMASNPAPARKGPNGMGMSRWAILPTTIRVPPITDPTTDEAIDKLAAEKLNGTPQLTLVK